MTYTDLIKHALIETEFGDPDERTPAPPYFFYAHRVRRHREGEPALSLSASELAEMNPYELRDLHRAALLDA